MVIEAMLRQEIQGPCTDVLNKAFVPYMEVKVCKPLRLWLHNVCLLSNSVPV